MAHDHSWGFLLPCFALSYECFESIDVLHVRLPDGSRYTQILRLTDMHRLVLHLLGPAYESAYLLSF